MAHCMDLRVGTTHHPLHMDSHHMVVHSQAIPLLHTLLVQMPLCTQASQLATLQALIQGSHSLLDIQDLATRILLPCLLSFHLQYHQMS